MRGDQVDHGGLDLRDHHGGGQRPAAQLVGVQLAGEDEPELIIDFATLKMKTLFPQKTNLDTNGVICS